MIIRAGLILLTGLAGVSGLTLVFAELRWFQRSGLVARLSPYAPGGSGRIRPAVLSVGSVLEILRPPIHSAGERLARLFGVNESLGLRLRRIHSSTDPVDFRVRQLSATGLVFVLSVIFAAATGISPPIAMVFVVGGPVLAFLLAEQQVVAKSTDWQRRTAAELPVVTEQLAMLMAAGWSLTAALNRIAARGHGVCATDVRTVMLRMRQGLGETQALREWSERVDVEPLHRLVAVLAMNREASDLGRLITAEAHAMRRDAQRQLIESIERRSQQVWIPVTVAALVPGVLLMGVPFVDALRIFSST